MKKVLMIIIIAVVAVSYTFGQDAVNQSEEKWLSEMDAKSEYGYGEDSVECMNLLSQFQEFTKKADLKSSYPSWSVLFNKYPKSSQSIYSNGVNIVKFKMSKASNRVEQQLWVDTLMLLYDRWIHFFADKSEKYDKDYILSRKNQDMRMYCKEPIIHGYNTQKKSIELHSETAKVWDGKIAKQFAGGSGTEEDPYLISNGQELALINKFAKKTPKATHYKLTSDIILNTNQSLNRYSKGVKQWSPIYAEGSFDGDGHTVYGVFVVSKPKKYETYSSGLFGWFEGPISNLHVRNSYIEGVICVGGIAGECYQPIKNCSFDGTLVSKPGKFENVAMGGIVGRGVNVQECVSYGTLNGKYGWYYKYPYDYVEKGYGVKYKGGIIGVVCRRDKNDDSTIISIAYCANFMKIMGDGNETAGIVGYMLKEEYLKDSNLVFPVYSCYNNGEILSKYYDVIGGYYLKNENCYNVDYKSFGRTIFNVEKEKLTSGIFFNDYVHWKESPGNFPLPYKSDKERIQAIDSINDLLEKQKVEYFLSLKERAEKNDKEAFYELALLYEYGDGTDQDYERAFNWYQKAANLNNINAWVKMGDCYYYGNGADQNYKTAFTWYQKAANKKNVEAYCRMGKCFEFGTGAAQNIKTASQWYQKAVDTDSIIGKLAYENFIKREDYKKSIPYKNAGNEALFAQNYQKAVENYLTAESLSGDSEVQYRLGVCYDSLHKVGDAFLWYSRSAAQGNENANKEMSRIKYKLGVAFYQAGDYSNALKWYKAAVKLGNAEAANNIGCMYFSGTGVKQDLLDANYWFRKAEALGSKEASHNLYLSYMQSKEKLRQSRAEAWTDFFNSVSTIAQSVSEISSTIKNWNNTTEYVSSDYTTAGTSSIGVSSSNSSNSSGYQYKASDGTLWYTRNQAVTHNKAANMDHDMMNCRCGNGECYECKGTGKCSNCKDNVFTDRNGKKWGLYCSSAVDKANKYKYDDEKCRDFEHDLCSNCYGHNGSMVCSECRGEKKCPRCSAYREKGHQEHLKNVEKAKQRSGN
ncbi:MAG: sel1 repeat family protein [Bacteroidales bacterium]|nr:sel1 repeat family protein [Bacteroidales bacterium]